MAASIKVSADYRISIPQIARKKLNIKQGDRLLVDVQGGVTILIPQPKRHTEYFQGLHSEIWKGLDTQKYLMKNATREPLSERPMKANKGWKYFLKK